MSKKEVSPGGVEQSALYGTFFLGGEEFCIRVSDVREVVPIPPLIVKVPLTPGYVEGVFNLRAEIIPILNLKKILRMEDTTILSSGRVAIVDCNGAWLGVLFDSTGEVLSVSNREISTLKHGKAEEAQVIEGIVRLEDGERVLQLVCADLIAKLESVPHLSRQDHAESARDVGLQAEEELTKAISFEVDGTEFAIEMEHILEIIQVPKLTSQRALHKNGLGVVVSRGNLISVLDFRSAMGGDKSAVTPEKRLLVATVDGRSCGLLVDRIREVVRFRPSNLRPLPPLKDHIRRHCFKGFVLEKERTILLLDAARFLNEDEILEVLESDQRMADERKSQETVETEKSIYENRVFIVFTLENRSRSTSLTSGKSSIIR